jgi:hypothetical protein
MPPGNGSRSISGLSKRYPAATGSDDRWSRGRSRTCAPPRRRLSRPLLRHWGRRHRTLVQQTGKNAPARARLRLSRLPGTRANPAGTPSPGLANQSYGSGVVNCGSPGNAPARKCFDKGKSVVLRNSRGWWPLVLGLQLQSRRSWLKNPACTLLSLRTELRGSPLST